MTRFLPKRLDFWFFAKIVIFSLFGFFLIYPFVNMFIRGFTSTDGTFSLAYFQRFAEYKYYYQTLFRSLSVAVSTTFFAMLVGMPMAYAMSRYNLIGKRVINIMIIMSLMSPPFIGAYSWILLLGRSGVITKFFVGLGINMPSIYGYLGIILVFTLKLFPYIYLYVSGALGSIDSSLEEAAENLGSNKLRRLMTITFPVILPTILSGAIMVFMSALADFGTPMLIGEGYKVLPVLVYEEYMSEIGGNAGMASALSMIVIMVSMFVLLMQKRFVAKRKYTMSALRPPQIIKLRVIPKIVLSCLAFIVSLVAFLPQIVVVYTSFVKTSGPVFVAGYSLDSYRTIFYRLARNITNTFTFSTIAMFFIIIIGILVAYLMVRRPSKSSTVLDVFVMFPYVVPSAIMGISLLLAFNRRPLLLAGTSFIMIVAYAIRKMPYTVRSASAILQQIDPSIEDASINLGVSPIKTFFTVTSRLMLPGIISGAILSWISTINELGSSVMLYTGRTATISVAIYTEVIRNSFGTAAALASILTVATILSFIIFALISKGKVSVI
ncbi:MAG: iron ABC transporter permease [Firmicutes bacterium HGW-Firmicutes-20]|jgi:iron(III) transport system permease protein|nr:MAG: iron ABC transporter permease [Firmicutes bacterium HGW-Firmicutes-20]PKM69592.1 MAG: iron ABC transporter permease [Firmicutes bacterium HGW-Firmicutes-19]